MASYSVTCTDTTVTMRVSDIKSGQIIDFYVRLDSGNSAVVNETYTATSTSMSKTFDGLTAGTYYACNVRVDGKWIGKKNFTTDSPKANVQPWSWTSSNGSASASQTKIAYYAVAGNGNVSDFSYLVWNDLVNKTIEVLEANGYSWNNSFASYYGTLMDSSDRELTATRFNSLRFNIGVHSATGIQTVYRGDIVYGWYFTQLTNSLNAMI